MSACCCWDFTLGASFVSDHEEIIGWLKENCKKWALQLELGEEKGVKGPYLHYQGRFSLNEKIRGTGLKKLIPWEACHFSPTIAEHTQGEIFYKNYVMKSETRVEGPWMDGERVIANYTPKQIREITEWYPYQESIAKTFAVWDIRRINILLDDVGGKGKTTLAMRLMCEKVAYYLPFLSSYKDLMSAVMDRPRDRKGYIIDVPRGLSMEKLNEFFSALELIKGGYAFDTRYKFKDAIFDCPCIWVIINLKNMPWKLLSKDRWLCWRISDSLELKRHKCMKELEEEI